MAPTLNAPVPVRPKIKKIAVLTDFSQKAETALRFAAAIAGRQKAAIVLAHAYLPMSCAYAAPESAMVLEALEDEQENLKAQLLKETRAPFLRNIHCSVLIAKGVPHDLLNQIQDADMMVVGTSGETGLKKLILGSVAETIVRSSRVPVVTVGPHYRFTGTPEDEIDTVLYATDFSPAATAALPYALSIAQDHGANLVLLNVVSDKDVGFSFEQSMAGAEPLEHLHQLVPDGTTPSSQQPTFIVGFGKPDTVILEKATELKASLIVLGARGRGALAEAVSHSDGGTAYWVAAHAECPVLMVPQV